MASRLPVIASNVGGIPSMIEHNRTGLLVAPRNHRELAQAMIALLRDSSERQRLAAAAREVALARHLPAHVAEQTLRVYHDLLAKERIRTPRAIGQAGNFSDAFDPSQLV
jgi:glycosyltransferase involved in cell wall biosynthesis